MPRSRQPTENERNDIFGGFFSHNALSGLFFLYRSFVYISWSVTVFYGIVCGRVYVTASVCVSYALSLAPFFCLLLS